MHLEKFFADYVLTITDRVVRKDVKARMQRECKNKFRINLKEIQRQQQKKVAKMMAENRERLMKKKKKELENINLSPVNFSCLFYARS